MQNYASSLYRSDTSHLIASPLNTGLKLVTHGTVGDVSKTPHTSSASLAWTLTTLPQRLGLPAIARSALWVNDSTLDYGGHDSTLIGRPIRGDSHLERGGQVESLQGEKSYPRTSKLSVPHKH